MLDRPPFRRAPLGDRILGDDMDDTVVCEEIDNDEGIEALLGGWECRECELRLDFGASTGDLVVPVMVVD